jgi:hypothetical protein
METGLRSYRQAALNAPAAKRKSAFREVLLAEQLQRMMRSDQAILEFEDLRLRLEKAADPAPFVSIFTANDVRKEHLLQNDDTQSNIFAVAATCELCGRPAVTNIPRNRCAAHRA